MNWVSINQWVSRHSWPRRSRSRPRCHLHIECLEERRLLNNGLPNDLVGEGGDVPVQPNISIVKLVDNPRPNVGDVITFSVMVNNGGLTDATNVTVNDTLPAGLQFLSAFPSLGSYDPNTGVWDVGVVEALVGQTLTITARVVSPDAQTNVAVVHADLPATIPIDTASVTETPQHANLFLTKTVNKSKPTVGDTITYEIDLTNLGPDPATNVTVNDLLPTGLQFLSATPTQGAYDSTTNVWTVGDLDNGASATLTFVARVNTILPLTNTAIVSHSDQFDLDAGNNTSSVSVTPQAVSATGLPPSGSVGAPVAATGFGVNPDQVASNLSNSPTAALTAAPTAIPAATTFLPPERVSKAFFLANSDEGIIPATPATASSSNPPANGDPGNQALVASGNAPAATPTVTSSSTTNAPLTNSPAVTPSTDSAPTGNKTLSFNQAGPTGMGTAAPEDTTLSGGSDLLGDEQVNQSGIDSNQQGVHNPARPQFAFVSKSAPAPAMRGNEARRASRAFHDPFEGQVRDRGRLLEIDRCFAVLEAEPVLATSSSAEGASGSTLAAFLCLAGLRTPVRGEGSQVRTKATRVFTPAAIPAAREKRRRAGRRRGYARSVS